MKISPEFYRKNNSVDIPDSNDKIKFKCNVHVKIKGYNFYKMKKAYLIFLLITIFTIPVFSQNTGPEWIWQNPYPQNNPLYSVKFNAGTGWAAGDYGTIIRSTNNGSNWLIQKSNSNKNLRSIFCLDQSNVFVVGNEGEILKTSNGGNNWNIQNSGSFKNLNSIFFINLQTGWAVGESNTIVSTTNGGINWTSVQTGLNVGTFNSVFFINADTGWVAGSYNTVLITTNGGTNWNTQLSSTFDSPMYSIRYHNGSLLAAGYQFNKSTNFGNTWINIPVNGGPIYSYDFVNTDTAFGIGAFGSYIRTTNGGNNWNSFNQPNTPGFINSICFQGAIGHIVGEKGFIFATTNSGVNWFNQSSDNYYDIRAVYFPSLNTGWAVGRSCMGCSDGLRLKTTDGGINWIDRSDTTSTTFNDVYFIDENTGWTCGSQERILKTTNGGDDWSLQYLNVNSSFASIYFYDHNTGWAAGVGIVVKTTDGGSNWSRYQGMIPNILSEYFLDQDNGWAVGDNGRVYKTTNGGLNWIHKPIGNNSNLTSVFFISSSTGWICGGGTYLIKTTNGGENWFNQTSGLPSMNFMQISFANENEGYAVGNSNSSNGHGIIIHTTNGGMNWEYFDNGPSSMLNEIFYNPYSRLFYAAGENGTILRGKDSVITSVFSNEPVNIPDKFLLKQNYPNPFNPVTKIGFSLPPNSNHEPTNVKLIVYNVLGEVVAVLINEKLTSGNHEVEFDASDLSSGICFYKLTQGEFSETKKMIILK